MKYITILSTFALTVVFSIPLQARDNMGRCRKIMQELGLSSSQELLSFCDHGINREMAMIHAAEKNTDSGPQVPAPVPFVMSNLIPGEVKTNFENCIREAFTVNFWKNSPGLCFDIPKLLKDWKFAIVPTDSPHIWVVSINGVTSELGFRPLSEMKDEMQDDWLFRFNNHVSAENYEKPGLLTRVAVKKL